MTQETQAIENVATPIRMRTAPQIQLQDWKQLFRILIEHADLRTLQSFAANFGGSTGLLDKTPSDDALDGISAINREGTSPSDTTIQLFNGLRFLEDRDMASEDDVGGILTEMLNDAFEWQGEPLPLYWELPRETSLVGFVNALDVDGLPSVQLRELLTNFWEVENFDTPTPTFGDLLDFVEKAVEAQEESRTTLNVDELSSHLEGLLEDVFDVFFYAEDSHGKEVDSHSLPLSSLPDVGDDTNRLTFDAHEAIVNEFEITLDPDATYTTFGDLVQAVFQAVQANDGLVDPA